MRTRAARIALFLAAVGPRLAAAEAPPPRAVSLTPADAAADVPPHTRAVAPNGRRTTLPRIVPVWQEPSAVVATGRWRDGVAYILIASRERGRAAALEPAFEALVEFAAATALIIDARFNAGGDEELARRSAGCFATRPTLYARRVIRTPDQRDGWSPPQSREVTPTLGRPCYRGPVAVLMGP